MDFITVDCGKRKTESLVASSMLLLHICCNASLECIGRGFIVIPNEYNILIEPALIDLSFGNEIVDDLRIKHSDIAEIIHDVIVCLIFRWKGKWFLWLFLYMTDDRSTDIHLIYDLLTCLHEGVTFHNNKIIQCRCATFLL